MQVYLLPSSPLLSRSDTQSRSEVASNFRPTPFPPTPTLLKPKPLRYFQVPSLPTYLSHAMSTSAPLQMLPREALGWLQSYLAAINHRCTCGVYHVYSRCGHLSVQYQHKCGTGWYPGTPIPCLCTFPPQTFVVPNIIVSAPCPSCARSQA